MALNALTWDYPTAGRIAEPKVEETIWPKSTAGRCADQTLVSRLQGTQERTVPPLAGCWIYSGVMPKPGRKQGAQARAQGRATDMAGAMRGQAIAHYCTTAPLRVRTASRGASEKSWCGGTRKKQNGQATIITDFKKDKAPDYKGEQAQKAGSTQWTATNHSACIRIGGDGLF